MPVPRRRNSPRSTAGSVNKANDSSNVFIYLVSIQDTRHFKSRRIDAGCLKVPAARRFCGDRLGPRSRNCTNIDILNRLS
jgi:hypothetical protein